MSVSAAGSHVIRSTTRRISGVAAKDWQTAPVHRLLAVVIVLALVVAACDAARPSASVTPAPTASVSATEPPAGGKPRKHRAVGLLRRRRGLRPDRARGGRDPRPPAEGRRAAHDDRRGAAPRGAGEDHGAGAAARGAGRDRAAVPRPRAPRPGRVARRGHRGAARRPGRRVLPHRHRRAVRRLALRWPRRHREDHLRPRVRPRPRGPALRPRLADRGRVHRGRSRARADRADRGRRRRC